MEKIVVFESNQTAVIRNIAAPLRIKVMEAKKEMYGATVGQIAGEVPVIGTVELFSGETPKQSLLLFCNVTDKHLDKVLAELKKKQVSVDLKAILTPTNQNWHLQKLYFELLREKAMMQ
ncbi:MAG: DUF3783 domain-containing protein [Lachnospiraceae bacterium]